VHADLSPEQYTAQGTPLPSTPCPYCQRATDAAAHAGAQEARPAVGDISVCVYCATVSVFTAGYQLHALAAEELSGLPPAILRELRHVVGTILTMLSWQWVYYCLLYLEVSR
jgi:hypothetical protein